jgi:hypothetical protein
MISLQIVKRVIICHFRVDFRRAHNGLMASAVGAGLDPNEGDLVLFVGRRRDRIKILFRDSSGCMMIYKLFDELYLQNFKFYDDPNSREVSAAEVALLLEGKTGMLKVPPKNREPK